MDEFKFDKFENGRRFQELCNETNFICSTCNRKITEIRKKKTPSKVISLYGYFCLKCDEEELGLIEWRIKVN